MKSFTLRLASLTLMILTSVSTTLAQESFRIASDSSSGTYNRMLGQLIGVCSTEGGFSVEPAQGVTGGAVGNLEALRQNRADAAFLHSDVFVANQQADPAYGKMKTLASLWLEPIHVLALRISKTSKLSTFSYGKQEFNTLTDLKGFKVGAAGGGVMTAKVLQGNGEAGFQLVEYQKGDEVIAALTNGDIAAAIFVGAAPLPNIEKLNKTQYKLLPIGDSIASRVRNVYRETNINYAGLTSGPMRTLAPVAVILTKQFSTEQKTAMQKKFRSCFAQKLDYLKDTGDSNWEGVEKDDHGTLNNWLDLGTATPVPARGK